MNAKTDTQENTQDKSMVPLSNPTEPTRFDPNDLRSLVTFEDATRLLTEAFGEIADATTEIGDGFTMLDDKDTLINVPLILLHWTFAPGDFGKEFVIARAMTDRGDKVILTDGGTGLSVQLSEYTKRTGKNGGLLCPRGLRKSDYVNEFGAGTTHYLNV